jgi:alpha-ketoglutaric semialdehyde dehydrogenase
VGIDDSEAGSNRVDFRANLINGQWSESTSGRRRESRNPADREHVVCQTPDSEPADVQRAIDAAAAAFDTWATMAPQKRGAILLRAAEILHDRLEEAVLLLSREMGKSLREARGEVARSVDLLRYYAGWGWRLAGDLVASDAPNEIIYTMPVPLGVVTLITPWNFPSAIPVWKMAPALVTGNTVVLKPANPAPASSHIVAQCMQEAGLPAGVLNIVMGGGRNLGDALTLDPRVKAISFTGSCAVGNHIFKTAGGPQRRVGLEMGGKNPLVVMPDADLDAAVRIAVAGAMLSTGQKCTATSRVIVHDDVLKPFTARLLDAVRALRVGNPLDESTDIGPVVDEAQLKTILEYIRIGRDEDKATLSIGGRHLTDGDHSKGFYVESTVFTDVTNDMRIAQEEIFGPVLAVLRCGNLNEAIDLCNDVAFGLSAGVCTKDMATAWAFVSRIEVGLVHVNNPTAGAQVHVPFGGSKASSSGDREMGRGGIDFFTQIKTVYHTMGSP